MRSPHSERVADLDVGHVDRRDCRADSGRHRGTAAMKEMILEAFNIEPSKKISRETQFWCVVVGQSIFWGIMLASLLG